MKTHATLLRTILLGAVGATLGACSSDPYTPPEDTTPGHTTRSCTNPQAIDSSGGLVRCEEGYVHRPSSLACPNILPRNNTVEWPALDVSEEGTGGESAVSYTVSADECASDSDCGEKEACTLVRTNPLLACGLNLPPEPETPNYERVCVVAGDGCITDTDCAADEICSCGELLGSCQPLAEVAGCQTDDDCAGDALCVRTWLEEYNWWEESSSAQATACQLDGDACQSDEDCDGARCWLESDSGRVCQPVVVCGRPFLIEGSPRLALALAGSDWPADLEALTLPSDDVLRAALARHFTQLGLMEHASVAAFARFTLQLLSLGAPAELIEASNAAIMDETRHARLAFALASQYTGESVGAGRLRLDNALAGDTWEAVFEATVLEGCIGETRAALEASWAAEQCADPVVRGVLEGIARDETRHAELAWRVASWMLRVRPELARQLPEIFAHAHLAPAADGTRPEQARAWGVLSHSELQACWQSAWTQVITPCARVLLETQGIAETPARTFLVAAT